MRQITLYKYKNVHGGTTVSPTKPEGEYTTAYRLVADEGKILACEGKKATRCVDVDNTEGWYEVEVPENMDEILTQFADMHRALGVLEVER